MTMVASGKEPSTEKGAVLGTTSGQRCEVTVMFVDVVNSTSVFERLDPEYVHGIMNGCFAIILDEVHDNGGRINQFRGDCAMAIFEGSEFLEDHALRACRAARAVVEAMVGYGAQVARAHGIRFQVRVGLHSGPVVVGAIGEALQGDFVAESDTTCLAARLESLARSGTILVSRETQARAAAGFDFRLRNDARGSETSDLVDTYELTGEKSTAYRTYLNTRDRLEAYTPRHLAEKILTTRSAMEGERKTVTVMFVDAAGAVFGKIAAEALHQIMDGWFRVLLAQVHRYEGIVNQFRGDRVMAIFGAPIAHEDHASRACHAALGIMEAMAAYGRKVKAIHGVSLAARIGLNTGHVVVGSIGNDLRMDYTADGDPSNLAARMQSHACPGTALVSANTYHRVGRLFHFSSLGKIPVKGKAEPVAVYALLGRRLDRPRLGLERRIYSEMVGRDRELTALEALVGGLASGTGAVVTIVGEAGIGKSRLVTELKGRAVMKPVRLMEGKAISIGTSLSFYPVVDLLKSWAGIGRDDNGQTALAKLDASVRDINPEHSQEMIPFIATLMGMALPEHHCRRLAGITGEALENLIFKNFRELLILVAAAGPVVIVLEDLHWADASSIELIGPIFRLARRHPIVFVILMRPGYEQTTGRLLTALREDADTCNHGLTLAPLDAASSQRLIGNMLDIKGLPAFLVGRIVERADGNPYFIEEVVRSLIDEGLLVARDGGFEATDRIQHAVIPETITDLLAARIDRLEEKSRELIKTASVIGRSFFYRILKAVAESGLDIDQRLAYLKEIQMIFERQRIGEIEYLFTHALAQEAAYASILLGKRKPLHLKVARAIEGTFADSLHEFYGILSYHYTKGEDFLKAEAYLLRSGEEALKSSASSEAVGFFQEALRLYRERLGDRANPEKIAYMEKCIAVGYYNKGQLVESIPYLEKVLEHCGIRESKSAVYGSLKAAACLFLLVLRLYLPFLKSNRIATEKESELVNLWFKRNTALAIASNLGFFIETMRFLAFMTNYNLKTLRNGPSLVVSASLLFSYGGLSFSLARKIIDIVRSDLDKRVTMDLLCYEMAEHILGFLSGDFKEEAMCDVTLVEQNLRRGEVVFTTFYINQFIFKSIEKGELEYAVELIEKEAEIIETYRSDFSQSLLLYLHARVLLKKRKLADAIDITEQAIIQAKKAGDLTVLRQIYSIKARMHVLTGDMEKAEHCMKDAEQIKLRAILPFYLVEYHLSCFIIALMRLLNMKKSDSWIRGERKKVIACGKRAARVAQKAVYNSVELYRYMGIYYWHFGRQEAAFKYWNRSIKKGEHMGARPELARTCLEVGWRLSDPSCRRKELNGLNADAYLARARKLFEDMAFHWDLEQMEMTGA